VIRVRTALLPLRVDKSRQEDELSGLWYPFRILNERELASRTCSPSNRVRDRLSKLLMI